MTAQHVFMWICCYCRNGNPSMAFINITCMRLSLWQIGVFVRSLQGGPLLVNCCCSSLLNCSTNEDTGRFNNSNLELFLRRCIFDFTKANQMHGLWKTHAQSMKAIKFSLTVCVFKHTTLKYFIYVVLCLCSSSLAEALLRCCFSQCSYVKIGMYLRPFSILSFH